MSTKLGSMHVTPRSGPVSEATCFVIYVFAFLSMPQCMHGWSRIKLESSSCSAKVKFFRTSSTGVRCSTHRYIMSRLVPRCWAAVAKHLSAVRSETLRSSCAWFCQFKNYSCDLSSTSVLPVVRHSLSSCALFVFMFAPSL